MGFRFRQKIKICDGISLNLSKKGVSSLTLGGRGAALNVGRKGMRATAGIPGSGMSYSSYSSYNGSSAGSTTYQNEYTVLPIMMRTKWKPEMADKAKDEDFYIV